MKISYETIKFNDNLPAKIELYDGYARRCKRDEHWHREIELIYMLSGTLEVVKSGESYQLKQGDVFLLNSGEIHEIDAPEAEKQIRCLTVHLSYDYAKSFYPQLDNTYFAVEPYTKASAEIVEIMKQLAATDRASDEFASLASYAMINSLLHILLEKCRKQKQISLYGNCKVSFRNAKIVMEYVEQHYSENITAAQMAEYVGLTPTYFSNYFKKTTGTGFASFLSNVRLKHAVEDLLDNGMSVAHAAENNGFSDASAFVNACKRGYGMTPLQLKRSRARAVQSESA